MYISAVFLCWAWRPLGEAKMLATAGCHLSGLVTDWWDPCCKPSLAVTCARLGATWKELQCRLRLLAT